MSNEQRYFDALKRIATGYHKPEWFEKNATRAYGCSPEEAMSMAYENMQQEARAAVKGKRRPQ